MAKDEILDIRMRALEDAAVIADECAKQSREAANKLHVRSNKLAKIYGRSAADDADQTKISAQVLDACAEEAESIAFRIRALKPKVSVDDFVEGGGDDGVERNPVPAIRS